MSCVRRPLVTVLFCLLAGVIATMSASADPAAVRKPGLERFLAKLDAGQQVTIVALGDSNTELTFHTRGALNWVGLLQCALFDKYGANRVLMINAACCGEGAAGGLARLDRDVLRFAPDLVIVCYWDNDMTDLRQIVEKVRATGKADVLLRTPNPVVVPNMPPVNPPLQCNQEWPGLGKEQVASKIVALGQELGVPVVDHYTAWLTADTGHEGPPVCNPNKLWLLMSDATHPGPLGHIFFYRQLAPYFGLPEKLPWEL
jgi:lysophospholipase L1-like esterase